MVQRVVGGLAERFFDLRFPSPCSTTAACTRGRLLFSSSGSHMVFTKTGFEKGSIDLLGMRMVLSHCSGWLDATCDLWGYVDGFLSDVIVSIALVSGCTQMVASGNWIFFPEASSSYFGTFLVLGNDRVDALSVYAWFPLVSFVRDAMGASRDSSDRSHFGSMGCILLPACVQFVPGFVFTSPFGSPRSKRRFFP